MRIIECVSLSVILFLNLQGVFSKPKEWWETTVIYQIYPRSYKDSNADGIGDLNGILEKLDYIKDIGVQTIWIQPFYESPMADFGYDVADFTKIEPMFGTMNDMKNLIKGIHDRDMKLVLDFVPNHVSDENVWFQKSVDRVEPYTDFFVWHSGKYNETTKTRSVPNNWLSIFGGSAWQWVEKRHQYYLSQFSRKQPDLNYRSAAVKETMSNVLRFWLDLGVDGFRIDAVRHVIEDDRFLDEPYLSPQLEGSGNYAALDHIYTVDQEGTYSLTHEWRELLEEYKLRDNITRIICTESYAPLPALMKYFGNSTYRNAHFPFYFGFVFAGYKTNASQLNQLVHDWIDNLPPNGIPNWVVSNHDQPRFASRAPEATDAMNMLQLLLPGAASVYYGDEIGMTNALVREDQSRDPNNAGGTQSQEKRDGERSPMQWDDTKNAGFTGVKTPWLPVSANYWYMNVKQQLKEPGSHLDVFKRIMKLRSTPVIKDGILKTCVLGDWTFMYVRHLTGRNPVVVVVNFGSETESICAQDCNPMLEAELKVVIASKNSGYKIGDMFSIGNTEKSLCSELRPKAGIVLSSNSPSSGSISSRSSLLLCVALITLLFHRFI